MLIYVRCILQPGKPGWLIYSRAGYSYRGFGSSINPVSKSDSLGQANTLYEYDYYGDNDDSHDPLEDNLLVKLLKYLGGDPTSRKGECYGDYCDYYYDDGLGGK